MNSDSTLCLIITFVKKNKKQKKRMLKSSIEKECKTVGRNVLPSNLTIRILGKKLTT